VHGKNPNIDATYAEHRALGQRPFVKLAHCMGRRNVTVVVPHVARVLMSRTWRLR
jgi:hypothetical protein